MATKKNPAAVALGRLGGMQRARNMSPEERSEAARLAGREGGKAAAKVRMKKIPAARRREIARLAGKASAAARAAARK